MKALPIINKNTMNLLMLGSSWLCFQGHIKVGNGGTLFDENLSICFDV